MPSTTRLRILDILRKQQTVTTRELGRLLGMTGANIRHHLSELESNGLICVIGQRREGRGRPENIYGLSRQVLGDGLDGLARALLDVWLKNASEAALEASLKSVAFRLGDGILPAPNTSLIQRLAILIDRLNQLHYQSRWEAGVTGPHIILGHCPYAAIINTNPELCRMDSLLIEQLADSQVEQMAKLQENVNGYPYCAFRVVAN